MDGPVMEIRMQSPGYGGGEPCVSCGKPSSPFHGLPVFNGDIVSNDWPLEWGGVPCCEACHERHERGELPTADHLYRHLTDCHLYTDGAGI